MVSSLDGFIAKKDGNVSWMQSTDTYEKGVTLTQEQITDFVNSIDCYVMGSKTYEHALELGWPYGEVPVVVLTHRKLTTDKTSVEFYTGDLSDLVNKHLKPRYKNIWMVGGAELTKDFIRLNLADDIVISMMPVILGDGILFFDHVGKEQLLHLRDVTAYKDGMVELTYEIKKE
ncbi:dihydrofolate reductase [Leptobacterium flavescens]|uniref:Dihydrofolate reductase n=2 Tax=Leptobacterium flavescens TaxID=472055 RepID=A0A6P0UT97_9FLAO|nr:dihydrofolate reductase [Leptobacterium flavescens]